MGFASTGGHVIDETYSFKARGGKTPAEMFFHILDPEARGFEHRRRLRASLRLT